MFHQVEVTNNAWWCYVFFEGFLRCWAFLEKTVSRQVEKIDKSSMKVMSRVIQKSWFASFCSFFGVTISLLSLKKPRVFPPINPGVWGASRLVFWRQASEDVACEVAHLCRPEGKLQLAKAIHLAAMERRLGRWDGGNFRAVLCCCFFFPLLV